MAWVILGACAASFLAGCTYMYQICKSAMVKVVDAHIEEYH